jgi:hypothetical protein
MVSDGKPVDAPWQSSRRGKLASLRVGYRSCIEAEVPSVPPTPLSEETVETGGPNLSTIFVDKLSFNVKCANAWQAFSSMVEKFDYCYQKC